MARRKVDIRTLDLSNSVSGLLNVRRTLQELYSGPFADGNFIENVDVQMNVPFIVTHSLTRPATTIVVVKSTSFAQMTVRIEPTVFGAQINLNNQVQLRPSANGRITLWVA